MAEPSAHTYDPTYFRAQGWWRDETLGGWLERCAASRGDHAAVMIGRQSFSYENLKARVTAFASGLHRIGITPGDVVAVHLPNIPEFLIAWFAINARGAIMQTIHMPYGMREVEHMLRHSGAKAVIALSDLRGRSPAMEIAALKLPGLAVIAQDNQVPDTRN
jgi:non-ribosomal peptide synthetase component E (peptide arylation enzyme)